MLPLVQTGVSVTDLQKALDGLTEDQVREVRLAASKKLQEAESLLLFKLLLPPSLAGAIGVFIGSLMIDLVLGLRGFSLEAISLLTLTGGACGAIGGVIGFKRYNAMLLPFVRQCRDEKGL